MLYSIVLHRPVPIPSLPLQGSPSVGLLETPQVSYLVIFPIHQHKHGKRRTGLSGQLIAGHMNQAKSQWAAGEGAAVLSFQQQRPDLPSSPAQRLVCFRGTSAGQQKTETASPKVVFPVKPVNITKN